MSGSGYGFISITSSRKRTESRTIRSISSQSIAHEPSAACRANFDTLREPRLQASFPKRGCSPQGFVASIRPTSGVGLARSEEHTSELQSQSNLVCRLLLEKKKHTDIRTIKD